jgi:hypothetical protein
MNSESEEIKKLRNNPNVSLLINEAYVMGVRHGIQMAIDNLTFFKEVGITKLEESAKKIAEDIKKGKLPPQNGNA